MTNNNLQAFGYVGLETPPAGHVIGRVIEQHREQYSVITEQGEVAAQLKGSFVYEAVTRADLPCVGDFVVLLFNDSGPSLITKVLSRRTVFSRFDAFNHGYAHVKGNREQMVATNFDYVFILTSLNRDFNIGRILRYLTQTRKSGGEAVVILTKADLVEDYTHQVTEVNIAAPEVNVHVISSHTGVGLDALARYLQPGKTIVFLGMSGVGKSSLLNAMMGEEVMAVKETRKEDAAKGRHTTTHRQILQLPSGALVMDTPGMRELGLVDAEESISDGFADVEALFIQCRFTDCRHKSEPGCAVQSAIKENTLTPFRWEQYQKQQREIRYAENRAAFLQRKTSKQK